MRRQGSNKEKVEVERLAEMAKRGDKESLISLCQAIASDVLFRTTYLLRNTMDAEDAAQEILIRVCERIHGLKDPKAFRGWLNVIIENEIKRYLSKNAKHTSVIDLDEYLETELEDDDNFLPDDYAIRKEDRNVVMDIINSLPARQREVIFRYYYEGLSVNETAEVMEVTQSAVSHYLKLAKAKIQEEVQKQSEKTGTLNALTLLPIGGLLANIFHHEATQISLFGDSLVSNIVSEEIHSGTNIASRVMTKIQRFKVAIIIVASTVIVIVSILFVGGVFSKVKNPKLPLNTQGQIVFIGSDNGDINLNPKGATVSARNENGELIFQGWYITSTEETTLYRGNEPYVDNILIQMHEDAINGDYILCYLMRDTSGNVFNVTRPFTIKK